MNSDYYISAVFLNANDYLVGDSGYYLYTDLDSFHFTLNYAEKAIVHSSNISSTTCYNYPSTTTPSGYSMQL